MNGNDSLISMAEIQQITRHCLALLSDTARLRQNASTKDIYACAEELFPSIRKLLISALMHDRKLICVAGLQGVGKTTLMKNFYGLDDRFLRPILQRGERLPVLITEKEGASAVSALALRIEEDERGGHFQREVELSGEEFASAVSGNDEHIMYLELLVPFRHTNCEGISFLLLPGFERGNQYWNDLIEFSINSSDAAVFVFNETSFSNAANEDCLKWIEERFGKNLVYVITGADASRDTNAAVKETCIQTLKVAPDRVVCTGNYLDRSLNETWIADFKNALERYVYTDMQQIGKNSQYLYHELNEIADKLCQIQMSLERAADDLDIADLRDHAMLKEFDRAREKQRKLIERDLNEQFQTARAQSVEKLRDQFEKRPKSAVLKRIFFGNDLKQSRKITDMIEGSLRENDDLLPNKYMRQALQGSLTLLEQQESSKGLNLLLGSDVRKEGENRILKAGEATQAAVSDVRALLADPCTGRNTAVLESRNTKWLMRSMAELSTYYFSLMSFDALAAETGSSGYEPPKLEKVPEHVLDGAGASKKFVVGMAGMLGVDLLGDGSINMIAQIAASMGIATPVAGAAAIVAVGAGAVTAMVRDLNRMQREDFNSASLAVSEIYDKIRLGALAKYDSYMERIRERIEDNISAASPYSRQAVDIFNAQREAAMAAELLEDISGRARGKALAPWSWG